MERKQRVFQFLRQQTHLVISTVNSLGNPEAAWVGFGEAEDLSIIFGTSSQTRKYKNIQKNPRVACTVSTATTTVQYEGKVVPFADGELEIYKKLYFTKTPSARKYEHDTHEVYIKVVPVWIRYVDFSSNPIEIFEVSF